MSNHLIVPVETLKPEKGVISLRSAGGRRAFCGQDQDCLLLSRTKLLGLLTFEKKDLLLNTLRIMFPNCGMSEIFKEISGHASMGLQYPN